MSIPPDSIYGPIETRLAEIVARVADNLHGDPADPWIASAVTSAAVYVIDYTDRNEIGLPADEVTVNGLVEFASRIYTRAFNPGGATVAIADPSFTPIFQPRDLYTGVDTYFNRLNIGWGIA